MSKRNRVFIVGVGMTNFMKPKEEIDYVNIAEEAISTALADSGLPSVCIEQAVGAYIYGESTSAQRACYDALGHTGIPIYNVNNNCASGSTALYLAYQFIAGGLNNCTLAFGFEKMKKGSLGATFMDRTQPVDKHVGVLSETYGISASPMAAQFFGAAGKEFMEKYPSIKPYHFAKIGEKNHRHSKNNPKSQFRDVYTLEQIQNSRKVYGDYLTKLQCSPTSSGSAAAILCSYDYVLKYGLQNKAIEIAGIHLATDMADSFNDKSMMKCVGYNMAKRACTNALIQANLTINDVQVIELHDCFSPNELITYSALGCCKPEDTAAFIDNGDNDYGGKFVVNPSGGLISKGHPISATGIAQACELYWQLQNKAEKRQVPNAKVALQHNLGLGGACVVAVYKKPTDLQGKSISKINTKSRSEFIGQAKKVVEHASNAKANASNAQMLQMLQMQMDLKLMPFLNKWKKMWKQLDQA